MKIENNAFEESEDYDTTMPRQEKLQQAEF